MRLIWTTENADHFRKICSFLHAKGISISPEEQVARDWSKDDYGTRKYLLWIQDEDQVDAATLWLSKFTENPDSEEFTKEQAVEKDTSPSTEAYIETRINAPITHEPRKVLSGNNRLTTFILMLCTCLFLYELYTQKNVYSSPIREELLFDYPKPYELLGKLVSDYGIDVLEDPKSLPKEGQALYLQFTKAPMFIGYYPYLLAYTQKTFGKKPIKTPDLQEVTLFEKIREGQIWRLISPVVLHADLLHLFFNMIWVLLLGSQIEARLGIPRMLLLMLIAGVISNTSQYLMSGPNFVGFSGIICAMATYIRARQTVAPWESYLMSKSTFAFIMFFIGTLAVLSATNFFFQAFQNISLPIAFANTAHVSGAIIGYLLGKMNFFSWQLHD